MGHVGWFTILVCISVPPVCDAGAIILDQRRGVVADADLHVHSLIDGNVTWSTLGESEYKVGGQSGWLDWGVTVEAYQQSGITSEGFWGIGDAVAATKWSPVVSNVTLWTNAFSHMDVHFRLDQRTPFRLEFIARVNDPRSQPWRTDALLYLNGPPGTDIWEYVEDGDKTLETSGWLLPGEYYFQVWASSKFATSESNVGHADYFVYLEFPEPSTLTALAIMMLFLVRRSRPAYSAEMIVPMPAP